MAKRFGMLVLLKPGITQAEADETLEVIRHMETVELKSWVDFRRNIRDEPSVRGYDDDHGTPVWYIP